jgi:hypothetical protein
MSTAGRDSRARLQPDARGDSSRARADQPSAGPACQTVGDPGRRGLWRRPCRRIGTAGGHHPCHASRQEVTARHAGRDAKQRQGSSPEGLRETTRAGRREPLRTRGTADSSTIAGCGASAARTPDTGHRRPHPCRPSGEARTGAAASVSQPPAGSARPDRQWAAPAQTGGDSDPLARSGDRLQSWAAETLWRMQASPQAQLNEKPIATRRCLPRPVGPPPPQGTPQPATQRRRRSQLNSSGPQVGHDRAVDPVRSEAKTRHQARTTLPGAAPWLRTAWLPWGSAVAGSGRDWSEQGAAC